MTGRTETEIKLRLADARQGLDRIALLGAEARTPRSFEWNEILDNGELRASGGVLRLRQWAGTATLTYKGPSAEGARHKTREEWETVVADLDAMRVILNRLGYLTVFRYEKYRTAFYLPPGEIVLDETPIGCFLELEGPADWIDRTAARLGFDESSYVTASYGSLYLAHCLERGIAPTHMIWS